MAVYYFVCGEATLLTGPGANRRRAAMDAPTGEQPMDVLGAANTLHRVSVERLLPHRPPVTCVFPSARAREPFYATFSFVSRCHAVDVCGSRPRERPYVYTCVVPLSLLVRSSIRTTTTTAAVRARATSVAFV